MELVRHGRALPLGLAVAGTGLLGVLLLVTGRDAICPCGTVDLWHGQVPSEQGSQHLFDWYTFSHIIHGFLFYAALIWLAPRLGTAWRFLVATLLEIGWELVENSAWAIERYRTMTVAADYNGDSVLNALSDVGVMWLGFALARVLPVPVSVALIVAIEVLPVLVIRDGLVLNVVGFVWPTPAIVEWQKGG